ncbi:MAG: tRNA uridine-5-carboxymethylaminomethyl(34) synthesis GTPase MnmE [Bacteroidaceae bacterium]|nr:tRNA uridine-5-carboxymethylaminomethyl(34) synthesis GTPase MnmE [Bacteroidaceae bacterium]
MYMSTICAPATAPGGAMAIIRVSGPEAISITSRIFSKDLTEAKGYTLHYGYIRTPRSESEETTRHSETHAKADAIIDDVLVSVFRSPHSYTGEDSTEISCHGSRYIVQKIIEALIQSGARMATPGEFTKRAFLAGKMDLSQAEAVADLIASSSEATHRMAMSQMRGGFSRELDTLREQLLHITSLLELELDFSDHEDIEFADRAQLTELTDALYKHIQRLTDSFRTGNALKTGIPVAIIGAPNVGKSTLMNALVHDERAIVSDIQGTTRDLIEDTIQIEGITFRFIDTAGIRKTTDRIEQMGIERSLQAARKADIIILLTEPNKQFPDIRIPHSPETPDLPIVLRVINKSDLVMPDSSFLYHRKQKNQDIYISSQTGAGMPILLSTLVSSAHQVLSVNQGNDSTIVTNLRHYEAFHHALEAIARVRHAIADNIPGDLIAEDLRQCLHHLAEITGGEITSDAILSNIFKNFCIGK